MAVVIQEVCGSGDGGRWFPAISGVARSVNFYPIGNERPEDGIVKMAYGLGKAVVDGEDVLRFSPKYPRNVLQTSTPELTMKETQRNVYALNLRPEKFRTSVDDAVNIERLSVDMCGGFRSFRKVVSTWDRSNMRMVDSAAPDGPKFITFAQILKYRTYPLAEILDSLLGIMKSEVKCDVELEFAADFRDDGLMDFSVLQIRPVSIDGLRGGTTDWSKIDMEGAWLRSGCAIGPGEIAGISEVAYLKPETFDRLKTRQIADEVTEYNSGMRRRKKNYLLIGFGRWGTSEPTLGVPLQWSDISEAKAIVECSLEDFRIEPSQGTHFFQNLTSTNAGYINVNPYSRPDDLCDLSVLDALPATYETEHVRAVSLPRDLLLTADGRAGRAFAKFQ